VAKKTGWAEVSKTMDLPRHVPREAWCDFVEMREAKRAPLTPRACKIIFDKLAVYNAAGMDSKAVLEQSIERCWTTVYALKNPSVISEDSRSLMDGAL
jgi:hypothetical protein